jgi:hypothetical protein
MKGSENPDVHMPQVGIFAPFFKAELMNFEYELKTNV